MSKQRKKKRKASTPARAPKPTTVRASRREQRHVKRRRQERLKLAGWIVAAVVVVGVVVYAVSASSNGGRPAANPAEQAIPNEGRNHVPDGTPLQFAHYPPSSGDHYGTPLPWGFYEEAQPEGNWIHSLEHGGVAVLYNCPEGCPELVDQLRGFFDSAPATRCNETRLVVLPYSQGMEKPLTAVAWGHQLDLETFDADALTNFFLRYEDQGPETIACQ